MRTFRVLVVMLMCFVASGFFAPSAIYATSNVSVTSKPTPLLDGIMSYQSFNQIRTLPKLRKSKWKTLENTKGFLTVETNNFSHLGFTGTATFAFFKGRLLRTWFVTPRYVKYRNTLTKKIGIKWNKTGQAIMGKTELNYSWKTVTWSDLDLQQEASIWIGNQSDYSNQKM